MTLNSIIYTSILIVAAGLFVITFISFFVSRVKNKRDFALEIEPADNSAPSAAGSSSFDYRISEAINLPVSEPLNSYQLRSSEPRGLAGNYYYSAQRRKPLPRMKVVNDYYWYLPQKNKKFKYTP